jgi:hypothetical protein
MICRPLFTAMPLRVVSTSGSPKAGVAAVGVEEDGLAIGQGDERVESVFYAVWVV